MTLTIEMEPELERRVRAEAERAGVDASAYVISALEERLGRRESTGSVALPHEESVLLERINHGFSEQLWREYDGLVARRRAQTLSPEQHARLIALSDMIESAHAERLALVAELALRRGLSLDAMMRQLGLGPRRIARADARRR